ncbi:hypothetical protein YC2023_038707 [Brassica napus]
MAVLIICGLRIISNQNESRRNVEPLTRQSHLNYPGRRQLSLNDARLSTTQPRPRWKKKKINSPVLQKIVAGILSLVLRPRESRSPLVQTIARELLTCSVFQPLVNYVSPERIKKWTHQPPSREEQSVNQDSGDESHRMPDVVPQRRTEALHTESQHCLKNKSWVLGDNIEKLSSKSFAVYCITVTDTKNKTRYSNFERLHRQLEENRNYNLLLPPKPIFSSSTENAFVHRHCIQLEKYLQNLLSIANVDEQQKVWDFLSETSKNYSLGESSSWMRPNVIDVILNLADKVFQFSTRGFVRKNTFAGWKKVILLMRDAVDDWFLKKIHRLRNEDTVAHGIRWFQDILWPNGVFFTRVDDSEEALDQTDPNGRPTWWRDGG